MFFFLLYYLLCFKVPLCYTKVLPLLIYNLFADILTLFVLVLYVVYFGNNKGFLDARPLLQLNPGGIGNLQILPSALALFWMDAICSEIGPSFLTMLVNNTQNPTSKVVLLNQVKSSVAGHLLYEPHHS